MMQIRLPGLPSRLLSAALALSFFAFALTASGQTITGDITGTVQDPSGAVVVGASVTATNVDTGVSVSTVTNKSGIYSIRFLQVGRYRTSISASGFLTQVFGPFMLEQDQTAKVDGKLVVGETSTVVHVTGQLTPLLNTENSTTSTTFDTNAIENTPINARNFVKLTDFVPGAVDTDPQMAAATNGYERDTTQTSEVGMNGNRSQGNNYMLDGVEVNETVSSLVGYNPNIDALSEVTVISANPPAEYGNVNGGTVLALTKSGTNRFHGSAAVFMEDYLLDANSWSNKNKVNPSQIIPRNPYTQYIMSGTLGGPIKRDKLFFFIDYEGERSHTGGESTGSVLSVKMRSGDFSELLDPAIMCGGVCTHQNQLTQLYDPTNNYAAYPNNKITITNPVVLYLIAHPSIYPLPNAAPVSGSPVANNYTGASRNGMRNDQADVKIDWTPKQADRFSFRWLQGEASDYEFNPVPINFPTPGDYPAKGFAMDYVHTFSPRMVNEFRCCFFRTRYTNSQPIDPTGLFGRNGNNVLGIAGSQPYDGFAAQVVSPLGQVGTLGGGSDTVDNTFLYADNLTYQRGRHLFKAGIQFMRYQQNFFNAGSYGTMGEFVFNGDYTTNPAVIAANNSAVPNGNGFSAADWALDRVYTEGIGGVTGKVGQRQWRNAYFFQDDWKIMDSLTLNLGIRYEYSQPIYEVNNKEDNPEIVGGVATLVYAGQNGASRALYNATYHDLMPRVGFSYQVMPRVVLSGGYGITTEMEGTGSGNRLVENAPYQYQFVLSGTVPSTSNPGTFFQETNGFTTTNPTYSGSSYQAWTTHLQPEMVNEWNLALQYQFSNSTLLKATYLGESGQHLIEQYPGNQLTQPCYVSGVLQTNPNSTTCAAVDPAPYIALVGQSGKVTVTDSEGMMNYNALQVAVRQRTSHGLEFQVNYAYSHGMTNTTGFQNVPAVPGPGTSPEDSYNLALNYGPIGQDERHTINANAVYQMPFGRGRMLFSRMNTALDEVVGGWNVAMDLLAYSGFPVTIGAQTNDTYTNNATQRADHVGTLHPTNRYINGGIYWWGNQSAQTAYVEPKPGTFGSARPGSERGPGFQQYDFSLYKDFSTFREEKLTFRVDAFNALNIPGYANPSSTAGSSTFGQITSVRGQARQLQLSAKYRF